MKQKQDELITVHKCILNSGFADPTHSVDEMKKKGLKSEELVVPYTMFADIKDVKTNRGRK